MEARRAYACKQILGLCQTSTSQFQHGAKHWSQFQHWAGANMGANICKVRMFIVYLTGKAAKKVSMLIVYLEYQIHSHLFISLTLALCLTPVV